MADISKCNGKGCPLKENCWRCLAKADDYQWYIEPLYANGECEMFWNVEPKEK